MPQHSAEASPRERAGAAQQSIEERPCPLVFNPWHVGPLQNPATSPLQSTNRPRCLLPLTPPTTGLASSTGTGDFYIYKAGDRAGNSERPRMPCRRSDTQRNRFAEARKQQSSVRVFCYSASAWHSHKHSQILTRLTCCSTKTMA